ncbi:protein of unknown function (plasmid) [Rhodovastum atsumiense]|nr:protein of unknown function [Rhodovastum atsumiense]
MSGVFAWLSYRLRLCYWFGINRASGFVLWWERVLRLSLRAAEIARELEK